MPTAPESPSEAAGLSVRSEELLERLLASYREHFDIERDCTLLGTRLAAMARFYSRGERFVLVRSAKLWAVECNEYVLFFLFPHLGSQQLKQVTQLLEDAERELVKPHSEHMYTYLSAVILAEQAEPDALRGLKRYKWRKSYRFSLHGWCHLRLAVMDLSRGQIATNADGREMRKVFADLAAKPKV